MAVAATPLFQMEASFNESTFYSWLAEHETAPYAASIVYAVSIIAIKQHLETRTSYDLRYWLAAWSAALAIFSIMGTVRIGPQLAQAIYTQGWSATMLDESYYHAKPTCFWICLFIASKAVEFGDTLFIVLRKRPLIFLHYYHHISTLLFVCYLTNERFPPAQFYAILNYGVHSIMYSFYALKALRVYIPRAVNPVITALQAIQMILGMMVTVCFVYLSPDHGKYRTSIQGALIIYATFFALFAKFYYENYVAKRPPRVDSSSNGTTILNDANGSVKKMK